MLLCQEHIHLHFRFKFLGKFFNLAFLILDSKFWCSVLALSSLLLIFAFIDLKFLV